MVKKDPTFAKRTNNLRIGIDLDAIIADIRSPLKERIFENFGIDLNKSNCREYYFVSYPEIKSTPGGAEFIHQLFGDPTFYHSAIPIRSAAKILRKWRDEGHDLWIVTARPGGEITRVTKAWLVEQGLDWFSRRLITIDYRKNNTVNTKKTVAEKYRFEVFIDDHGPTIKEMNSPNILLKILVNYYWNILEEIDSKTVRVTGKLETPDRVDAWKDLDKLIQSVLRQKSLK